MQELDDLFRKCAPQETKHLGISVAESDRRVAELYHEGRLGYAHQKQFCPICASDPEM
jgi:formate dehydrogenase maturation protein FdhE